MRMRDNQSRMPAFLALIAGPGNCSESGEEPARTALVVQSEQRS
jgi:hypothetical protein